MTSTSQNSAPVHEYRCLFTHDLHKKQKKWHDGTLKFHTYNSRVMVYDDRKNFVGDLHYRGTEDFGEGLDIQLDKPVLVNVEDRLGESNTDLTEVLRQRNDVYTSQPTRTSLPRTHASTTQPKPKSIKDLLVASQGHLGRARLPPQSPFEQRQQQIHTTSTGPPTKKQKIRDEKENFPPPLFKQKIIGSVSATYASKQQVEILSDPSRQFVESSSHEQHVHVAAPSRQAESTLPVQPPRLKQAGDPASSPQVNVSERDQLRPRRVDSGLNRLTRPIPNLSHDSLLPHIAEQRAFESKSPLTFAPHKPLQKLRYKALLPTCTGSQQDWNDDLVAEKRKAPVERQSLLSSKRADLLELDRLIEAPTEGELGLVVLPRAQRLCSQDEEPIKQADLTHQNAVHGETSITSHTAIELFEPEHIHIDSSPLFVPHTPTQLSIKLTQGSIQADFEIPGAEQARPLVTEQQRASTHGSSQDRAAQVAEVTSARQNRPFVVDDDDDDDDDEPSNESELWNDDKQSCLQVCSASASVKSLEISDSCDTGRDVYKPTEPLSDAEPRSHSIGISNLEDMEVEVQASPDSGLPFVPPSPSATTSRAFRRVMSESNVDDRDTSKLGKASSPQQVGMLSPSALTGSNALGNSAAAVFPAPLPRSASDSAMLKDIEVSSTAIDAFLDEVTQFEPTKQPCQPLPRASQPDINKDVDDEASKQLEEQGPWTSMEAFLLFDWWPPNHIKPDYAQHVHGLNGPQTTKTVIGTKIKIANAATARSAEASIGLGRMGKYSNFSSARLVSQR